VGAPVKSVLPVVRFPLTLDAKAKGPSLVAVGWSSHATRLDLYQGKAHPPGPESPSVVDRRGATRGVNHRMDIYARLRTGNFNSWEVSCIANERPECFHPG